MLILYFVCLNFLTSVNQITVFVLLKHQSNPAVRTHPFLRQVEKFNVAFPSISVPYPFHVHSVPAALGHISCWLPLAQMTTVVGTLLSRSGCLGHTGLGALP